MSRRKTNNEFIAESKTRHGDDKYGYGNTIYIASKDKVIITCLTHGDFEQIANDHLRGAGCPKCAIESNAAAKRKTTDEFIEKATSKDVHGDTYEYGDVIYIASNAKVEITCLTHGNFFQTPNNHLQGNGCPKCAADAKQSNTDEFIAESNKVHGHKYGHANVIYIDNKTKVEITCLTHGDFLQTPNDHLQGKGCPKCAGNLLKTNDEFIAEATLENVHGDKYGYGDVIYIDTKTKVEITCPTHGNFFQTPSAHLHGQGCPICKGDALRKTTDEFIADATSKDVHGDTYEYGDVIYIASNAKVEITCLTHGNFFQTPNNHLQGKGCPKCNNSKGEQLVSNTLTKMNLQFKQQFKSEKCMNIHKLPFDFCVKINDGKVFLIEYQGEQHYRPVKWHKKMSDEKAEKIFRDIQYRDEIKRVYARKNNIPLLVISYKQKDIIDKLLANIINHTFGMISI